MGLEWVPFCQPETGPDRSWTQIGGPQVLHSGVPPIWDGVIDSGGIPENGGVTGGDGIPDRDGVPGRNDITDEVPDIDGIPDMNGIPDSRWDTK